MIKKTEEYIKISNLIASEIMGKLSPDEEAFLLEWLEEDSRHKKIYAEIIEQKKLAARYDTYLNIQVEKAWANMEKRIRPVKKVYNLKKLLPYAAAVALLIAVFSIYHYSSGTHQLSKVKELEITATEIVPGQARAILQTSSGEVISLEDKKDTIISAGGLSLKNESNTLSYSSGEVNDDRNQPQKLDYNTLTIPRGGEYKIILSDGTQVWINSETKLQYPTKFAPKGERTVFLDGEAYFDVAPNAACPFIVKTRDMDIKVLGTSFNVMAYGNSTITQTTLVEGKVDVTIKQEDKVVDNLMLMPNMQAAYSQGDDSGKCYYVNVGKYIAWKDGYFSFSNQRLDEILEMLARWYDVDVVYKNESIRSVRFTGDMKRFEEFNVILNLLNINSGISSEIRGKKLIIDK